MGLGDLAFACAMGFVDELVRGGVRDLCLSPGSRSTPLALAATRHGGLSTTVHLDERSSGFFAVGLAKALRRPVAVLTTSGTAAAELLPAAVEASQARVSLILLTADRPPHLRHTGANQTIDQVELFGHHARGYFETPVPTVLEDLLPWRRAAVAAVTATGGTMPGPVHVNCPFDEPLVPEGDHVDPGLPVETPDPRPSIEELGEDIVEGVVEELSGRRGIVMAGTGRPSTLDATSFLAARLGWPMLAEPTSNVRRPGHALAAGTALAAAPWLGSHRPETILQVGATPTTRVAQRLLTQADRVTVVDAIHRDPDVYGRAALRVHADAGRVALAVNERAIEPAPAPWLDDWRLADTAARRALDGWLDRTETPTELQVARDLAAAIPTRGTLFVGNSMPIRDLDYAMAPRDGLEILANRGASGIDGLLSTALGIAAAGPRPSGPGPTVALIGDLSLLHDAGALLWHGRRGANLTVVVPNNGGGQIFSFLGQRGLPELEPLFTTPHTVDLEELCAAAGARHARVEEAWAFGPALEHAITHGGLQVVEVIIDPDRNRAQHTQIQDAIDATLEGLS